MAFKEKDLLLASIDHCIRKAPDIKFRFTIKKVKSGWELFDEDRIIGKYKTKVKAISGKDWNLKCNRLWDDKIFCGKKNPKKILFEVPNSKLTYNIWNTKEALMEFRNLIERSFK